MTGTTLVSRPTDTLLIGYGSINHPVDRDPVCGYNGIIGDTCPQCGRRENERIVKERIPRVRET